MNDPKAMSAWSPHHLTEQTLVGASWQVRSVPDSEVPRPFRRDQVRLKEVVPQFENGETKPPVIDRSPGCLRIRGKLVGQTGH
jgi:hypothetical protein